jgi:hypothetical protein
MKAILRKASVNCTSPFTGDEAMKILDDIRSTKTSINESERVIEEQKASLKEFESNLEDLEQKLVKGEDALQVCTLHIRFDDGKVKIFRDDTWEFVRERPIIDEDNQAETGDTEVEEV